MHHNLLVATHKVTETLAAIRGYVKDFVPKRRAALGVFMISCSTSLLLVGPAQAEDAETRTMLNAIELMNAMNGLVPQGMPIMLRNLKEGRISRIAPEQPVWLLDAHNGVILYYQGQPSFSMQEASQLVDDAGQRFGQKAVDNARVSKPTWLTIKMAGQAYHAYCATRYPYVACSLNPKGVALPTPITPPSSPNPTP